MWFLFPLVVLLSSVLIGLLLVHEGFVGGLTTADRVAQEAAVQALQKTYGSKAADSYSTMDSLTEDPSLDQGTLYKSSRLTLQNPLPIPTPISILTDDTDDTSMAPIPPIHYVDPIAVQVGPPPSYPFPTADRDTCETICD